MTKGILIVGYGTRKGNLTEILERQAARLKARGRKNVYISYFRVSHPSIPEALEQMAKDGVDDVLAIPYYIAEGRLTYELIPEQMKVPMGGTGEAEFAGKKVHIAMAPAFGMTRVLTEILFDRIADAGATVDDGILVIGHGSRDVSSSNSSIIKMNADRIRDAGYKHVAYGFNEFNEPGIPEAAEQLAKDGVKRIVVVPLFIATGIHLGVEIAEKLKIPEYSDGGEAEFGGKKVQVVYCRPVEDDPRLLELIDSGVRDFTGE